MTGSQHEKRSGRTTTLRLHDTRRPTSERHCLVVWVDGVARSCSLPRIGEAVIGRAPDSAVRIESRAVSRKQAVLAVTSDAVTLTDAGSRNGTQVNGTPLVGACALTYGDVISFGDVYAVFEEDPAIPKLGPLPFGGEIEIGNRT